MGRARFDLHFMEALKAGYAKGILDLAGITEETNDVSVQLPNEREGMLDGSKIEIRIDGEA